MSKFWTWSMYVCVFFFFFNAGVCGRLQERNVRLFYVKNGSMSNPTSKATSNVRNVPMKCKKWL